MTQKELKNGNIFKFNNEAFCIEYEQDDIRECNVWFDDGSNYILNHYWAIGFNIEFNGKLVHSCKTYKSLKYRLDELVAKWSLNLVEIQNKNTGETL